MRKIGLGDITIRKSGKGKDSYLSFREKIETAKLLDKLGVSVIEIPQVTDQKYDLLMVKSLASAINNSTLAVPVDFLNTDSVGAVCEALAEAQKPRLQVAAPVSTVQMEYFCHKKPAKLKEAAVEAVKICAETGLEVEFVAQDAGRAELDFVKDIFAAAAEAGASVLTFCDTAGTLFPDEFGEKIREIRAFLPEGVKLGVECSHELYMANSCAVEAVRAGADEVKTQASGDSVTNLEQFAGILALKGRDIGVETDIRTTEIRRVVRQIRWMCETDRSQSSPFDSGVRDTDDTVLSAQDDLAAVAKQVARLGYELSDEDMAKVYEAFSRVATKKDTVDGRELDAIIASAAMQVPSTYTLESYVINASNVLSASCNIVLKKNGEIMQGISVGGGPIDAAFLAIEQIAGTHYELDDFQVQSVTEGREAMGQTVVRLRSNGKVFVGQGISRDIIGASIMAYISALNKIIYEEEA